MCSSPQLIAACHVLHRLLMPRHSPCALYSLTFVEQPISISCSLRRFKELCRLQIWFIVVCVTHLYDSTNFFVTSLLLARNFLLCFTVQFSRCRLPTFFKVRLKCSHFCENTSIQSWMVEIIGIEPMASCLQGRRSPS